MAVNVVVCEYSKKRTNTATACVTELLVSIKFHLKVQEKLNHKKIRKAECVRSREQCNGPKPENHRPTFRLKKKTHVCPYFWRSSLQQKKKSNQNKGHLGSRYIIILYIIYCIYYFLKFFHVLLKILGHPKWLFGENGPHPNPSKSPHKLRPEAAWLGGFTSARARCRRRSAYGRYQVLLWSDHLFSKMGKYETIWNNMKQYHICM